MTPRTLLQGHDDQNARFAPTIVMRRAGGGVLHWQGAEERGRKKNVVRIRYKWKARAVIMPRRNRVARFSRR